MDKTTTERFTAALHRAAARDGIPLDGIQWAGSTLEQTWGTLVGLVFYGCAPEVNERAARFFATWYTRHTAGSSYAAQRDVSERGEFYFRRFTNGAKGWHPGTPAPYEARELTGCNGFVLAVEEEITGGFAVSTTYYPCAE